MRRSPLAYLLVFLGLLPLGCGDDGFVRRPPAPAYENLYAFNEGCFVMDATAPGSRNTRYLVRAVEGTGYEFSGRDPETALRLTLKASDLGTYLIYDQDRNYLVSEVDTLGSAATLENEVQLLDDTFVSPAEWEVSVSAHDPERLALRSRRTGRFISALGTTADPEQAGVLTLYPAEGCTAFPEMTLDATGESTRGTFDDGDLFGFVDAHSHLLTNFGFGGGGIFHGAPFHRLGVEAALPDCERFHGLEGRRDLVGYFFDGRQHRRGTRSGRPWCWGARPRPTTTRRGYPDFVDWPNARESSTHQVQYYKWLERAYLSGLRLVVQHATGNQVLCDLVTGSRAQSVRYSCNDMVGVDREIDEAYAMERYIDAQSGGPGARAGSGSSDARPRRARSSPRASWRWSWASRSPTCSTASSPREGFPTCDEAFVRQQLDHYHDPRRAGDLPRAQVRQRLLRGRRQPRLHRAGQLHQQRALVQLHLDCPGRVRRRSTAATSTSAASTSRATSTSPSRPLDVSKFASAPARHGAAVPRADPEPALEGPYCQNARAPPLGEHCSCDGDDAARHDHRGRPPSRSARSRAPTSWWRRLPGLGQPRQHQRRPHLRARRHLHHGLGRCRAGRPPGRHGHGLAIASRSSPSKGGYPAEGFGFDLNGFAGAPGRASATSPCCGSPQSDPVTYPFMSYAAT
jgi:hypothetical protein